MPIRIYASHYFSNFIIIAAQSIIAALGCLTLVAEVLWAPIVFGELLGCPHYIGCMLIVSGEALALSFGPHAPPRASIAAVSAALVSPSFVAYMLGIGTLAGGALVSVGLIDARYPRLPQLPRPEDYQRCREGGASAAKGQTPGTAEVLSCQDYVLARMHRPLISVFAGLVGALTLTLSKGLGETLGVLQRGGGREAPWTAAGLIVVLVPTVLVGVLVQARLLHSGASRFGSTVVLLVHQATWTLGSVAGGLLVWGEGSVLALQATEPQGAPEYVLALGVVLVLCGVAVVCGAVASDEDASTADAASKWRTSGGSGSAKPATAFIAQESTRQPLRDSASDCDAGSAIISALALEEEGRDGGSIPPEWPWDASDPQGRAGMTSNA